MVQDAEKRPNAESIYISCSQPFYLHGPHIFSTNVFEGPKTFPSVCDLLVEYEW